MNQRLVFAFFKVILSLTDREFRLYHLVWKDTPEYDAALNAVLAMAED